MGTAPERVRRSPSSVNPERRCFDDVGMRDLTGLATYVAIIASQGVSRHTHGAPARCSGGYDVGRPDPDL
jgi:hypothetical protein